MKYDIITIGDALEDVFVKPELRLKTDKEFLSGRAMCVEFGEKTPLKSVDFEVGGSACNTSVGFSRLRFKTGIVSMLGEDEPKNKVIKRLKHEKVDTKNLIIEKEYQTGYSVIFSVNSERTIFVFHGPKDYANIKLSDELEPNWFYIAPLGHNTEVLEKRLVSFAAENGTKIAWNPGSIQINKGLSHFRHLLKCTSVLFLNKEEAIKFLDLPSKPDIREVMKKLQMSGPKIVVITNGKEGAKAYDGKEFYSIEANSRVEVEDVTGAGDAFAVGFLSRIMKEDWNKELTNYAIQNALKFGIKSSTSVIQYIGAQKGLLKKIE